MKVGLKNPSKRFTDFRMATFLMCLLFGMSCTEQKNSVDDNSKFYYSDSLNNGISIDYVLKRDSVFIVVSKAGVRHSSYFSTPEAVDEINNCLFYKPDWWSDDILVLSKGCGVAYGTEHYVYRIDEHEMLQFLYSDVIFFDSTGLGAYAQDASEIVIVDFYKDQPIGTFDLATYGSAVALEQASPSLLEDLDPKFVVGERREIMKLVDDTLFFSFLGKDTFYRIESNSASSQE